MGVKKVKPTSPGRRSQSYSTFDEITSTTPEKSLLKVIKEKVVVMYTVVLHAGIAEVGVRGITGLLILKEIRLEFLQRLPL